MGFSYTTTGATNQASIVRGNVGFVGGTFTADGDTDGEIVTGLSLIMGYDVSANVNEKGIRSKKNDSGAPATSNGSIGIIACQNDEVGDWWAIGLLSGTSL